MNEGSLQMLTVIWRAAPSISSSSSREQSHLHSVFATLKAAFGVVRVEGRPLFRLKAAFGWDEGRIRFGYPPQV